MDERKYIVYLHRNIINNKIYVGLTKQNINERWGSKGQGYKGCTAFYNAIQKYGWDNFEHIILEKNLSQDEAAKKEKYYIQQYNSLNPEYGYNIQQGGFLGPQDFQKMREHHQKEENKYYGADNVNSKRVQCKETGEVFGSIKEANRWCGTNKVGDCCNGKRKHAGRHPDTNQLLSWQFVSDNIPVTKICHKPIKEKTKYFIQCINTGQIFINQTDAGRYFGLSKGNIGNIGRTCKGLRNGAGKHPETGETLIWQYIEEDKVKKEDITNGSWTNS